MTSMGHIHHLEGIYGIPLGSSPWYLPRTCHLTAEERWELLDWSDISWS